jgi:TM2 domain-containing membrane protein YozV
MIKSRKIGADHMRLLRVQSGKIGYILLWLLGVPIPILLIIYLLRGCT